MSKIAVVYWSGTGCTEEMANIVAEGVQAAGGDVTIFGASEFSASQVDGFDGFAFGCPAMGAEVLEETEFEPMFTDCESSLAGKKVGLFGSYGWGDGEWMRDWEDCCKSNGMPLVSEGVICMGSPDRDAENKCKSLAEALV